MLRLAADGSPDEEGVRVMALEVPKSTAIVASRDGKILRRLIKADGSPESVPMYPYEIITRLSTIGQLDYSSLPLPNASMEDFSKEELARLRDILSRSRSNGDQALLELPDDEMLSSLRVVAMVDGRKAPTVTGILLAGKREAIARCVPTSGAAFQVLEGTEVRVNQDFDQPLLYTIEKMRAMLEPWNPEREYEEGLFRQPVPEFDHRAFREALVNAFGHRDYASLGRVRVLVDDEGLAISNPGGFVEGVTIDNLLTVEPHGRNECLMGALKRIGLAEKTGRGVDRIYEGSLYCGRPLPDYSASTSANVTVFIARSAPDKLFMRMINEERERTGRPLSLRSLLVLDALKRQRRLTLADLCSQIHATDSVTRSTVENLVEAGLVEGVGNASGRAYMLSGRVYSRSGKDADFVRQSDIDKIRYPELIMKLAHQQGGTNRLTVSSRSSSTPASSYLSGAGREPMSCSLYSLVSIGANWHELGLSSQARTVSWVKFIIIRKDSMEPVHKEQRITWSRLSRTDGLRRCSRSLWAARADFSPRGSRSRRDT